MAEGGGTRCESQNPAWSRIWGFLVTVSSGDPFCWVHQVAGDLRDRERRVCGAGFGGPRVLGPSLGPIHASWQAGLRGRACWLWCGLLPFADPVSLFSGVRPCWLGKPDKHEALVFGGRGRVFAGVPSSS
jgi:hypothetical protein